MAALLLHVRSSSPSSRQLHHSWANENDARFFDNFRGFGSGSGVNKIDGYVWGFGISVEAIETSPAETGQSTPNTRITVRNPLGGIFDDGLRFMNSGTL